MLMSITRGGGGGNFYLTQAARLASALHAPWWPARLKVKPCTATPFAYSGLEAGNLHELGHTLGLPDGVLTGRQHLHSGQEPPLWF
jgi:hypothetical protein